MRLMPFQLKSPINDSRLEPEDAHLLCQNALPQRVGTAQGPRSTIGIMSPIIRESAAGECLSLKAENTIRQVAEKRSAAVILSEAKNLTRS
jgi:hypothetical protein